MVVMPSHYESFGMVALEAMAMGTPVIASEVGGLAFLVRDGRNGFLVPSRDPEALAERIFTLLLDDACRTELGRQAREHALAYDWPHITDKILGLYRRVSPTDPEE
jgi:D-inositol-3-phosphate glycosyltransferase